MADEPAYQELAIRITNPDILFAIYEESESNILKTRLISVITMQPHSDLSTFLARAYDNGDNSVKIIVVASLSSQPDKILSNSRIRNVLSNALKSDDVSLQKFAIRVIKSRNLHGFETTFENILNQSTNEYIISLIQHD